MTLVRRIARPLLGAAFIAGGVDAFRHPGERIEAARPLTDVAANQLGTPNDPELAVRTNGALMAGAGVLFALGRMPRTSAMLLAATLAPATYFSHPFWSEKDPEVRQQHKQHFLKNLGLLGGLLIAAVDTEGKPGIAYRSHLAKVEATRTADRTRRDALRAARRARKHARRDAAVLKLRAQQALPNT